MSVVSITASASATLPSDVLSTITTMKYIQCRDYCLYRFKDWSEIMLWDACEASCEKLPVIARALSTPAPTTATSFDATQTAQLGALATSLGLEELISGRDLSYAPYSTAGYVASGPSTVTITETWVHHDTVCNTAPVYATKSTPASYALSTSKSMPASYVVKTSSYTSPRPVYPTAPEYKPSSTKSTPGYVASSSKSTPATYAVSSSKSAPAYYVSTPKPITTTPHPVYPTGHYSQPTSAKYVASPPSSSHVSQPAYTPKVHSRPTQSTIMGHYTPSSSEAISVPTQPATNTTYNKPSATSSVPVYSETIISLGGASAYGISLGAVALAVAAML
ncbi:hypothetical protein Slin15195_G126110 [Septoria linicola]|uniref:Uncharacterized protein n=1 Tax=Septoria linicola TaxID=215465 RepID=A0A9Q9B8K5_9PEZI|nr:hypothetical protein Slin14017_G082290 [Septoria linicola]USW59292.1 hypothetical protein Slin15195_G126110 [Septoria linicola]